MRAVLFFLFLFCMFHAWSAESAGVKSEPPAGKRSAMPALPLPSVRKAIEQDPHLYKEIAFFLRALAIVRENYVDREKVSDGKLLKAALRGMLQELDPFCMYEEPEQLRALREDTAGRFAGIGLTLSRRGNTVQVVSLVDGAPAQKAGLLPGDVLIEVDGRPVAKMTFRDCVARLKGPPGTEVKVKVYRRKPDAVFDFTLTRAFIKIPSLHGVKVIGNEFGYIRISSFSRATAGDLDKALADFAAKKVRGIVIDLRNNPGGLLASCIDVADAFLDQGVIVSTRTRLGDGTSYEADEDVLFDGPMTVLINENSASASEVLTGALKDHGRAAVVGTVSYGKGIVQNIIPLGDGTGIKVTTSDYYTPNGASIHGVGITPDIEVEAGDGEADVQLERAKEALRAETGE